MKLEINMPQFKEVTKVLSNFPKLQAIFACGLAFMPWLACALFLAAAYRLAGF